MTKKTKIMNFVESVGGVIGRKGLVKFIVEMNGMTFDPIKHRGYYSCHLQTTGHKWLPWCTSYRLCGLDGKQLGYLMRESKNEKRHLRLISRGVYKLVK